jgi:hypothetical protein
VDLWGLSANDKITDDQRKDLEERLKGATVDKTIKGTLEWFNSKYKGERLTERKLYDLFFNPINSYLLLHDNKYFRKDLRGYLNDYGPESSKDNMEEFGYKEKPESFFANSLHNPIKNDKYLSKDGYREQIFDKDTGDKEIYEGFKASFNFFPYEKNLWGHFLVDMLQD